MNKHSRRWLFPPRGSAVSHDLQGELMRLLPSDSWVLGRPARHGAPQADQGSPGRGQAQTQDPAPLLARVLSFLLLQDIRTWTGPRDPWKDPPGEGLRKGQVSVLRGGGGGGQTQRDPEACLPGCGVGDGDGGREGTGRRGAPRR